MSYGADFATADPANAPLDPVILIGAEPMFWAAILLIILAALLAGYVFGAHWRSRRADAAEVIWKAIHDAARAAMGADDNALKGKTEALRKVFDERLGKTLKLVGGLSGLIKKLDEAVAGRGPVHSATGSGQQPTRAGEGGGGERAVSDHGHGGTGGGGGGGGGAAAATSVTVVTIGGPTTPEQPTRPTSPPVIGHLNHREQTDALRLAVAAFNEHWRDESARVRELREAHAELSGRSA